MASSVNGDQKIEIFNIKNVSPGMKVSQDIKDKKGFLLVKTNMELTDILIKKLLQFGVTEIPIFVSHNESNVPINNINLNDVYRKQLLTNVGSSIITFIKNDTYSSRITDIMTDITKDDNLMSALIEIKIVDFGVFLHSINVFTLATLIGLKNYFPIDRLMVLAQAALLHDIGKKFLPVEILQNSGNLSDEERKTFEQHALFGFEYLQTLNRFPYEVLKIIYEHHERIDGSGYPNKLKKDSIHKLAQIISIADTFDSIVGSENIRSMKTYTDAIEFLEGTRGLYFDNEYAKCLLDEIFVYRIHDWVILDNDDIGIVTQIHDSIPLRPVVTVFFDKFKQKYSFPKQLDLATKNYANVFIKKILD